MTFKYFKPYCIILIGFMFLSFTQSGPEKNKLRQHTNYSIQGLWEGTYTVGKGMPVPAGTSFYFSFSIYPDGKVSYKSKGFYNGRRDYITFADGTWKLDGYDFEFSVTTVNLPSGDAHQLQEGQATFNSENGTLSNGTFTVGSTVWSMKKIM